MRFKTDTPDRYTDWDRAGDMAVEFGEQPSRLRRIGLFVAILASRALGIEPPTPIPALGAEDPIEFRADDGH